MAPSVTMVSPHQNMLALFIAQSSVSQADVPYVMNWPESQCTMYTVHAAC